MKKSFLGFIVLAFSLSILSCDEGSNTIFDNIINDSLIHDSSLDNTLSVYRMVRFDPTSEYYIAAGNIYHRAVGSDSWSSFQLDSGIHNTIATNGTYLYIGVVYDNGSSLLYRYDPQDNDFSTNHVLVDLGTNARHVLKLKNFGTAVYAAVQYENGTSSLLSVSGTATSPVGAWASGLADVISDFSVGTATIIATGSHVYTSSTIDDIAPVSSYTYTGVGEFEGNVYLSTDDGALYRSSNTTPMTGSDWTEKKTYTYTVSSTTFPVRFTEFSGINGSPGHLFVGARGAGFFEIVPDTFTVSRFAQTSKADLYSGAVESFYIDTTFATPVVFFCTMGAGLWSDTYILGTGWGDEWNR